jgi:predicted LPLAT superfamily acyltransferase
VADRVTEGSPERVIEVPFLGDLAPFPQGPWILASLLGCPVYTIFCVRAERNRYDVFIEPFADKITLPGKQRETKLHDWICCYALNLEKYCCRFPHHWFNFYDFWSRSSKTSR